MAVAIVNDNGAAVSQCVSSMETSRSQCHSETHHCAIVVAAAHLQTPNTIDARASSRVSLDGRGPYCDRIIVDSVCHVIAITRRY